MCVCVQTLKTKLPPVNTSCLLITAAPHMTQSKSLIQSQADFSSRCWRKSFFVSCKGKGQHGLQRVMPSLPQQMNSIVVVGGQSPFQSDCVTRTLEPKPMEANKQSPLMLPGRAYERTECLPTCDNDTDSTLQTGLPLQITPTHRHSPSSWKHPAAVIGCGEI